MVPNLLKTDNSEQNCRGFKLTYHSGKQTKLEFTFLVAICLIKGGGERWSEVVRGDEVRTSGFLNKTSPNAQSLILFLRFAQFSVPNFFAFLQYIPTDS